MCHFELNNVDFWESREAAVKGRSGVVEALLRKQTTDLLGGQVSIPRVNLPRAPFDFQAVSHNGSAKDRRHEPRHAY